MHSKLRTLEASRLDTCEKKDRHFQASKRNSTFLRKFLLPRESNLLGTQSHTRAWKILRPGTSTSTGEKKGRTVFNTCSRRTRPFASQRVHQGSCRLLSSPWNDASLVSRVALADGNQSEDAAQLRSRSILRREKRTFRPQSGTAPLTQCSHLLHIPLFRYACWRNGRAKRGCAETPALPDTELRPSDQPAGKTARDRAAIAYPQAIAPYVHP